MFIFIYLQITQIKAWMGNETNFGCGAACVDFVGMFPSTAAGGGNTDGA